MKSLQYSCLPFHPYRLTHALPTFPPTLNFHDSFEIIKYYFKTFYRLFIKTKPPNKTTLALWVKTFTPHLKK